jgi:hypothetical protein
MQEEALNAKQNNERIFAENDVQENCANKTTNIHNYYIIHFGLTIINTSNNRLLLVLTTYSLLKNKAKAKGDQSQRRLKAAKAKGDQSQSQRRPKPKPKATKAKAKGDQSYSKNLT